MFENEDKWLSDDDIIYHTQHFKNQMKLNDYHKLTYLDGVKYFNYFIHTTKKKGKMNNLYKFGYYKIFQDFTPLIDKYFFELPDFRFKIFITYNHFIIVLKFDKQLEYFNPTGNPNDKNYKRLKNLIKNTPYELDINKTQFQKNNYSCGRWCILRALLHNFEFDIFYKIVLNVKEKNKLNTLDDTCDYILKNNYNISFQN